MAEPDCRRIRASLGFIEWRHDRKRCRVPGRFRPTSRRRGSTMNPQRRVVRVFVSSTFRDMFAEREELVKQVFPRLRKLCEERDVSWGEVDLRWGITEEQAQRG